MTGLCRFLLLLLCVCAAAPVRPLLAQPATGTLGLADTLGIPHRVFASGQAMTVQVVDPDRDVRAGVQDTVQVRLRSSTEPGGEMLVLLERGDRPGHFTAVVPLREAAVPAAGDGLLQAVRGDTVSAVYRDPQDDFGNVRSVAASGHYGYRFASGALPASTTWSPADGPVLLTGDLTVPAGMMLTISPGTRVYVTPRADDRAAGDPRLTEIVVEGSLLAEGTVSDSIRFASFSAAPGREDWQGIRTEGTGAKIRVRYVRAQHYGVFLDASYPAPPC